MTDITYLVTLETGCNIVQVKLVGRYFDLGVEFVFLDLRSRSSKYTPDIYLANQTSLRA